MTEWERKIKDRRVTVGVLGLGYVGLPLVREFASAGLKDDVLVCVPTPPTQNRELVAPILESSGLKAGKDFYLAYSPEREDPGNKNFTTKTIRRAQRS